MVVKEAEVEEWKGSQMRAARLGSPKADGGQGSKGQKREVREGERGGKTAEDVELTTEGPGRIETYNETEGESKNCRKNT